MFSKPAQHITVIINFTTVKLSVCVKLHLKPLPLRNDFVNNSRFCFFLKLTGNPQ